MRNVGIDVVEDASRSRVINCNAIFDVFSKGMKAGGPILRILFWEDRRIERRGNLA